MPKYLDKLAKSSKYESIGSMITLNEHLTNMITDLEVMIDSADMYCGGFRGDIVLFESSKGSVNSLN